MSRPPPVPTASRRHVLFGLGAAAAVPASLAAPASAAPAAEKPECLAGLVQQGVVDRGDFMAG